MLKPLDSRITDPSFTLVQPCVLQFCEWLELNPGQRKILDLGCGGHHYVGKFCKSKDILAVGTTVNLNEIKNYAIECQKDSLLMNNYICLFHDWRYFNYMLFPKFDIILALDLIFFPIDPLVTFDHVKSMMLMLSKSSPIICLNNMKEKYDGTLMTNVGKNRIKITAEIVEFYKNKVEFYKDLVFIRI